MPSLSPAKNGSKNQPNDNEANTWHPKINEWVRFVGLKGASHLNGKLGRVSMLHTIEEKGRIGVEVHDKLNWKGLQYADEEVLKSMTSRVGTELDKRVVRCKRYMCTPESKLFKLENLECIMFVRF